MASIEWLGHASFRIMGNGMIIYIDPWKLKRAEPKADVLLITHTHYDHFNVDDIAKITTPQTQIICSGDAADQLPAHLRAEAQAVVPGARITARGGIVVRAVAAYNIGKEFHPRANNWLGYVVEMGDETIYFAGDTDEIDEMSELGEIDVAVLPVGGTYTMSAQEAASAAQRINARRYVPCHYGDIVGTEEDAKSFAALCAMPVDIMKVVS